MYFNAEIETMPRDELRKLQLERLKQTLGYAYTKVAFHQHQFQQANVTPDSLHTLEDLNKFPFITKPQLRENYPFGLFAVKPNDKDKIVRLHASSGTKGKPTVVGYTAHDIEVWAESCARAIACAGGKPGDVLHVAYGYGLFTGGLGLHYGGEKLGACVIPASGGNTPRQILLMQDFQAQGLCCTPSYALNLAEYLKEHNIPLESLNLKYGILGAEPWTEEIRVKVEEGLGLIALDIYGLSEITGPGVSMECPYKQGLHIWEDYYLPEIINPATLEPLPDGEIGELVFTTLAKEAIPMIRYRTGDLCNLTYEKCDCGRTHARMGKIKGRIDDMLIVRGINVFPSEIERVLLEFEELAPHYQIVLERPEVLDVVTVHCESTTAFTVSVFGDAEHDEEHHLLSSLRQHIMLKLREGLGVSLQVKINPPHTIPRSEGKAVRVVDNRPK
ncbi:MAG: phenylacetate--CoA ligase [Chloroflexi bacterium]|uniref:Phenylacetate-coenzyme A ligase n=1 Tax=Candidatus Chlorohelix allophototropha TaxID=3003348 RepID=A0A8T7LRJ7_9CHLR|nr:phenylacetate--CoA ligase [Chloroflexota bacterium]WJW66543.1 phenylacetate--CoA ligase [Chloroflexota bacterium L227-S17]